MKQLLYGKNICVSDVPAPGLARGQVLVEVAYSFISTGTEVAGVKSASAGVVSKIKAHPQRVAQVIEMIRINGIRKTLMRVQSKLDSRSPLGYSCSGRVVAVAPDVQHLAVGDLVACGGNGYASHAEVVAVPANLVAKLPDGCDLRQASGTTVASIALHGVRRADGRLGETVVVMGLGLLGQIALQFLAASGVKVIGFDADRQRVKEALALGFADCAAATGAQAIDYVRGCTGQRGADAVLITAATDVAGICQDAMQMARRKGRVVVVGAVPLTFERDPFYRNEIDFLISSSYGPGRYDPTYEEQGQDYPYAYVRWTENRNMQAILQMIADGTIRLDKLIAAEYPIAEAEQAFAALGEAGGERPLAAVLKYDFVEAAPKEKLVSRVQLASVRPLSGRVGVGVVGLGAFCSKTHLPNLMALSDRYQITTTCDLNGARAQDVARQVGARLACTNMDELLADPDVQLVMITTRHDTHAPLALKALAAGKHVFVEKPAAMNADELEQLRAALDGSDRCYMVGFNRRFSPHVGDLRARLGDRRGPLTVQQRIIADPAPLDSWIYGPSGGGRVIGEACHMLDLFSSLVGDEVPVVELDVVASPPGRAGPPGDNFVATLRYEDGSIGTLIYSTLGRKGRDIGKERVEAMWDGWSFVIDDYMRSFGTGFSGGVGGRSKSKGHYEELLALAAHLREGGPRPIGVERILATTALSFRIDAACRDVGTTG
jgi:predicted dehydrogenase/threonine dehydrogenase-like Zn-dependent dehydrogenase